MTTMDPPSPQPPGQKRPGQGVMLTTKHDPLVDLVLTETTVCGTFAVTAVVVALLASVPVVVALVASAVVLLGRAVLRYEIRDRIKPNSGDAERYRFVLTSKDLRVFDRSQPALKAVAAALLAGLPMFAISSRWAELVATTDWALLATVSVLPASAFVFGWVLFGYQRVRTMDELVAIIEDPDPTEQ